MALAEKLNVSVTDYLAGELPGVIKHEFIDCDIFAMVGVKNAIKQRATNRFLTDGL